MITFESLITRYSSDVAAVTDEQHATSTPVDFIAQVERARDILATASVGYLLDASEEFGAALTYLTDALGGEADDQQVLLAKANARLGDAIALAA